MPEYTGRFESTVPYYARFRPRYPTALFDKIAKRCGLDGRGRLLDLGCGPGFIAIAMAPCFAEVVGVDPEPAMIDAARREAETACVKLTLIRGSSQTLGPELGAFQMVAMGRSFQWMDRDATLCALDTIIKPGGAIALLGERLLDAPENGWRAAWEIVSRKYAEPRVYRHHWTNPQWERHETVLLRSRFSRIDRLAVASRRSSNLDEMVGRAYSMSSTSIAALGDRREEFERELRAALLGFSPSGVFEELVESEAIIAVRGE
ncbi:MAG TPA: class I SAM-dependent methyltransferase [Candidatus Binataceae bacterium]|nr:class I SAM-dependent methyltransferase [Candidatus Binataceae bacterium]